MYTLLFGSVSYLMMDKLSESERRNEDLQSQVEISGGQLQELQRELCALKETLCNSKLEVSMLTSSSVIFKY